MPDGLERAGYAHSVKKRRFQAVPIRILLPNLVTLLALCMGLTAIRFAIEGRFETAILAILAAAILDGLDGRIARALKGATRFGAELDSLADFIAFGVAPAIVLYLWGLGQVKNLGWFAALIFAIAAALRLARFNVSVDDPTKPAWHGHFFTGMPAPAGAIVGLLPMTLHFSELHVPNTLTLATVYSFYLVGVALLMASRIPHFSGKKTGRVPREYIIIVLFAVAFLVLLLATYTMEMLVVLTLIYLGMIPFSIRRFARSEAEEKAKQLSSL
jgi:CDP-diacylglycerol--serine O-phosphatidyltransferase